jgi:hypothetical protein
MAISERISFITVEVPITVPVLIAPANEATVYGTEITLSWQQQASKGFRAELSKSATFPTRSTTLLSVDAFTYSAVYTGLGEGTYYLRVRAKNSDGLTDPSAYVTAYLKNTSSVNDINASDFCYNYYDNAGNCHLVINNAESPEATINIYATTGMLIGKYHFSLTSGKNTLTPDMTGLDKGLYLMKIKTGNREKTIKVKR